jgi:hypothetical protein
VIVDDELPVVGAFVVVLELLAGGVVVVRLVVVPVLVVVLVLVVVVAFDVLLVVVAFDVLLAVTGLVVVVAFTPALFVVAARVVALAPAPAAATRRTGAAGATPEVGRVVGAAIGPADDCGDPPSRASAVAGLADEAWADSCDCATIKGFGEFETMCTATRPAPAMMATAPIPPSVGGCSNNGRGIR